MKTFKLFALACTVVALFVADAQAGGRRGRRCSGGSCGSAVVSTCSGGTCGTVVTSAPAAAPAASTTEKPAEAKAAAPVTHHETVISSGCSNGTCGSTSRSLFRRR
jgi:hypothetical protein